MAESRELNLILRLKDEASKELAVFGSKLKSVQPQLQQMAIVGTAGFAAISAGIAKGITDFTSFDAHIQKAGANVNATGDTLQDFRDTAISAARGTTFAFEDTARALSFLAGGSVSAEEAIESLSDTVNFAMANNLELEKSAVIASQAMTLFGLEGNEVNRVLDTLSKAGQIAFATTDQMADAFSEIAPSASQLGVEIEDLTAIIGAMGDVGILGSSAGIALKRAFQEILNPSKQMQESLASVGLTTDELQKSLKNPIDLIKILESRFGDIEDPIERASALSKVFGQVSGPAMAALIGMGSEAIDEYREQLSEVEGTTDDIVKRMADAISPFKEMGDEFKELSIIIGQAFLPVVRAITGTLKPVIQAIASFIKENPKLAVTLGAIALALFGVIAVVGVLGLSIIGLVSFFGALATAIPVVIGFLAAFGLPILAVIAGITALIAVGVLLYKNWDTIKEKAIEVWTAITDFFSKHLAEIKDKITNTWNSIKDFFSGVWDMIKAVFMFQLALIVGLVKSYFDLMGIDIFAVMENVRVFLTEIWNWLKTTIEETLLFISDLWSNTWGAVSEKTVEVWGKIKGVVGGGWDWLKNIFNTATKPIQDAWAGMWDSAKGMAETAWETIKETVKAGINWIIEKINSFIRRVNDIARSGAEGLGISIPTIPEIPKLAKGGIVNKPTLALIGEAGPEAVVPLKGRNGMGGGGINITINGDVSGQEIINTVKQALMRELRQDTIFSV